MTNCGEITLKTIINDDGELEGNHVDSKSKCGLVTSFYSVITTIMEYIENNWGIN